MKIPRRIQLPDQIELHAKRLVDGRVEFSYIERVLDREILSNTTPVVSKIAEALRVELHQADGELGVKGTVARRDFGDMLVSEFLLWSHLADLSFGEFLGVVVAASVRSDPEVVTPPPLIPLTANELDVAVANDARNQIREIAEEIAATVPIEHLAPSSIDHINELLGRARRLAPSETEMAKEQNELMAWWNLPRLDLCRCGHDRSGHSQYDNHPCHHRHTCGCQSFVATPAETSEQTPDTSLTDNG